MTRALWLVTFLALGIPTAAAESQDDAYTKFIDAIDDLTIAADIPGLSIAVVKDHAVVLARGFGFADIEQAIPATADTPYDIASVTKPISAVLALRLVELGAIDLDRPIGTYSDWADFCSAFSGQPSIFARDLACDPPVHTLRHLLSHTATGAPGETFSYNPILFSWASRPIMAALEQDFSTLVDRHVFEPAGMHDSARRHRALELPAQLAARLAKPYRTDGPSGPVPAHDRGAQGDGAAGGVVSTVLDLARFDIALDQGRLISHESVANMMQPTRTPAGSTVPYGIGFYVQDFDGQTLVWHSGWWEHAYSALYLKVPSAKLTFIALANSEGIWWGNPLETAAVQRAPFAQTFFDHFLD